jgi:hypothetical protein
MSTEKIFLTSEELDTIQKMNTEFNKAKTTIGDIEMQKYDLLKYIGDLKSSFGGYEKDLIAKYGADSVINVQNGEVTKKTN